MFSAIIRTNVTRDELFCKNVGLILFFFFSLSNENRNVLPLWGSKHMSTMVIFFLKRERFQRSPLANRRPSTTDNNGDIDRRVQTRFQTVTSELKTFRIRFALVKCHVRGHVSAVPKSVPWMDNLIMSRPCSSSYESASSSARTRVESMIRNNVTVSKH